MQEPILTRIKTFQLAIAALISRPEGQEIYKQAQLDNAIPPFCSNCGKDCFIGYFATARVCHCELCAYEDIKDNKLNRDYEMKYLMSSKLIKMLFAFVFSKQ